MHEARLTWAEVLRRGVGSLGRRRLHLPQPVTQRSRLVILLSCSRLGHLQVGKAK